jgi:hypothetical protein
MLVLNRKPQESVFLGRISHSSEIVSDGLEIRPTWLAPQAA